MDNPEEEARRLFRRLGLRLPDEVLRFIDLHSRHHFTSPAISRQETALQLSTATARALTTPAPKPATRPRTRAPMPKPLATFARWLLGRKWNRAKTTTTTPEPQREPITAHTAVPDVHDYFGTVRDASYDGLQWLQQLPGHRRRQMEALCADVLAELNYPLVYPRETEAAADRTP